MYICTANEFLNHKCRNSRKMQIYIKMNSEKYKSPANERLLYTVVAITKLKNINVEKNL